MDVYEYITKNGEEFFDITGDLDENFIIDDSDDDTDWGIAKEYMKKLTTYVPVDVAIRVKEEAMADGKTISTYLRELIVENV